MTKRQKMLGRHSRQGEDQSILPAFSLLTPFISSLVVGREMPIKWIFGKDVREVQSDFFIRTLKGPKKLDLMMRVFLN